MGIRRKYGAAAALGEGVGLSVARTPPVATTIWRYPGRQQSTRLQSWLLRAQMQLVKIYLFIFQVLSDNVHK
uniref:Uncharacterized protein n=3 Tax=Oryza TaxID=4527 RepID=A0A0E0N6X8_ORYRU